MMRRDVPATSPTRIMLWVLLALFLAPIATGQADFSSSVSFGDSLTHNELIGFPFRIPLYGDDPMEAVFKKARLSGNKLTNYAVAGSHAVHVLAQMGAYGIQVAANRQALATMISYEIGGNDILDNDRKLGASPPGRDPSADKMINDLLKNIFEQLFLLYVYHPSAKFVIWTIPDITYTPKEWSKRNTTEGKNIRAHLNRINMAIRSLELYPQVVVLDTEVIIRDLAMNPPLIHNRRLIGPPAKGDYDNMFADEIHPTAVSNALLANFILDRMNARWKTTFPKYTENELAALARIP